VCPDPVIICGVRRYGEDFKASASPVPETPPPVETSEPPSMTEAAEGYSLLVFYTLLETSIRLFEKVTVTQMETSTEVDVWTEQNGIWVWTKSASDGYVGTLSIFSDLITLSQVSWIQAIQSTPFEGEFGINSTGMIGIGISAAALIGFIIGVIVCTKRADNEWQAEQRKLARQQQARGRRESTRA
jgi:hypothetical protein